MHKKTLFLLGLAAILALPSVSAAKVHAVSTDGEATVYLTDDFAHDFDLSYDVHFPSSVKNRSWSAVTILLLGRVSSSGSIGIGLSRGSPRETTLIGFTDAANAKASPAYRSIAVRCASECDIKLRGTSSKIFAFIDHRLAGMWTRKSLGIIRPYVQINGEVSAVGDRIFAHLTPVRTQVGNREVPRPTCAFTTQGIRARAAGSALTFKGRRDPHAFATYVSLLTGATGDTCPKRSG